MKKTVLFAIVLVSMVVFEGCAPSDSHVANTDPVGVLKLDPNEKILGYNWNKVDTVTGFTTMTLGFNAFGSDYGWAIDTMVLAFQKRFHLKVVNYRVFFPEGAGTSSSVSSRITIFYKPMVDPEVKKLQASNEELKDQNKDLRSLISSVALSNRQIKWQLKVLKKAVDEKE